MPRSNIPIDSKDFITGAAKGLAVLETFDTERQRINATVAAARTGMTRASARRHLLTLAHLGYLETDGSYFWLSAKVLRFSGSYLASARLPKLMQPTLNRLAIQLGESLSGAVLDGDEVVVIGRSGPTRLLAYGLHLGARLAAHATSTGRVLLASLPQAKFDAWMQGRELRRLTPNTIVTPSEFVKVIDGVRATDYCVADQEHELGVSAVAVPVRDISGHTVAALNVVVSAKAPAAAKRLGDIVQHLQDGARELRGLL